MISITKKLALLVSLTLAAPHLAAAQVQPAAQPAHTTTFSSKAQKIKNGIVAKLQRLGKNPRAQRAIDLAKRPVTIAGAIIAIITIAAFSWPRKKINPVIPQAVPAQPTTPDASPINSLIRGETPDSTPLSILSPSVKSQDPLEAAQQALEHLEAQRQKAGQIIDIKEKSAALREIDQQKAAWEKFAGEAIQSDAQKPKVRPAIPAFDNSENGQFGTSEFHADRERGNAPTKFGAELNTGEYAAHCPNANAFDDSHNETFNATKDLINEYGPFKKVRPKKGDNRPRLYSHFKQGSPTNQGSESVSKSDNEQFSTPREITEEDLDGAMAFLQKVSDSDDESSPSSSDSEITGDGALTA